MKRNLFIAAIAIFTTMGATVAQAQYRDCDRVAADIIGLRLGRNLSIEARLNDRHAYDDDRFWCSELHRRYGVQEVVLLERRRSGLSWLDILADVLWASAHRYDTYDRRTVVYYPQYTRRYDDYRINVRDGIGRNWDDRRWNDHDRDDRWRNDHDRDDRWRNNHDRNDHDRDDHRWDNNGGRNGRDWDHDRDRDRNQNRNNDRDRDRTQNHNNDRNNRGGNTIGRINDRSNDRNRDQNNWRKG